MLDQQTMAMEPDENWSMVAGAEAASRIISLKPGDVVAGRYEIIKLLGEGGMGAVYQVQDRELERFLALKVIRPELAGNPKILRRFKQELIVARQVTHKNAIRIFDLGSSGPLKFITMEYVEGRDLADLMEERRFGVREACSIMRQVCRALDAAHSENVVHRDLKPQNIMVNDQGRVWVMDFGLARSVEMHGLTQTGAVMGTPAYMSPEQAKGEPVDTRSDTFAFGIIFYELVTGILPFQADTILGSLLKRTQEKPQAPIELNPELPQRINDVILRCLEKSPADRFQSPQEILAELDAYLGDTIAVSVMMDPRNLPDAARTQVVPVAEPAVAQPAVHSNARNWIAALAVFVLVAGAALYWFVLRHRAPAAPLPPMTVLISDFTNHTGDPVFTGTLESTLKLALEGASFISAYDRTRMRDLGLRAPSGELDQAKAQEIATSQGLNVVISGSLDRSGSDYRLSASALQAVTGKVIATAEATAPTKDQVLFAVAKLGSTLRKGMGDATSESAQRLSMETLSSASLDAVHEYAAGLDALSGGKFDESQQHLSRALELDPNFGMAYTVMASAARNMGRQQDAEKYIREALKYTGRMTERERYRTRAYLYLQISDYQKCVDEYGALLDRYPADTGAHLNIAVCYLHLHNVPKALEESRRAVSLLPKRAIYHGNLAMNLAFGGDAGAASKEAGEAQKLGYVNSPLLQAYASLLQEDTAKASEYYRIFQKSNPSDAATGMADLAAYEGRYSDAVQILEKGIAADTGGTKPDPDAAATKLWLLADIQRLRGQKDRALTAAGRALELSKAFQTRFVVAQVYVALDEAAKARELAAGLASELPIEAQCYAKLIEGETALKSGNPQEAIKLFSNANSLLDTWVGRFDLGLAYLQAGSFPQADSEFDRCIKRRGEALALFLDLPTYYYFPPVYFYSGKVREGMKGSGASDLYKKYLAIRGKAGQDPLLAEARRHIAQ
jgi:tetratricopeptide (TPR) repeat protein/predicted Ser/Thr protein kinase